MIKTKDAEKIYIDEDFKTAVQKAKKMYLEGKVFVYPTDTIYGFGANPFNEEAVKRIDEIKRRESGKMYILLINNIETLLKYIEIKSEKHLDFFLSIWPNPVSIVLTLNSRTSEIFGVRTAAFRIPNNRFCLHLTCELQMPLISTSVNRNGESPLLEPSMIENEFYSEVDAIFYSNKKAMHHASTLIDLSDSVPVLLREGKIKFEDIIEKFENC
jgi:L-threonylcarbamoyladenylate synthase